MFSKHLRKYMCSNLHNELSSKPLTAIRLVVRLVVVKSPLVDLP